MPRRSGCVGRDSQREARKGSTELGVRFAGSDYRDGRILSSDDYATSDQQAHNQTGALGLSARACDNIVAWGVQRTHRDTQVQRATPIRFELHRAQLSIYHEQCTTF